jgi:hypothetical protein
VGSTRARGLAACPLLIALACRLAAQPAQPGAFPGPDDPVITLDGFCVDSAPQGQACKTIITRAQFEKLTEALQPGMPLPLRLKVANAYARNMRMAAAAEKRGLDKTPAFQEEMRFARMQLLSQDLNNVLQAAANDITEADLEDYYRKNQPSFEEATVARIFIPHSKQTDSGGHAEAATSEAAMTTVAADLRARAVRGEDPDRLQIEAYAAAGIARTTANTKIENVRRTTLPPAHETVLELQPGEVSDVYSDPAGAHFIYKMISKQILKREDVQAEIRAAISGRRYHDSMQGFQAAVVFNDAYFNPPGAPGTPPQRNRRAQKSPP